MWPFTKRVSTVGSIPYLGVGGIVKWLAPVAGKYLKSNGAGKPPSFESVAAVAGAAFPVGAVYISVDATNPGTTLGYGTWVAFGQGKTLVGVDSGDTDFDTALETGGSKTATVPSHPDHTHDYADVVQHTHPITSTDSGHSHLVYGSDNNTGGSALAPLLSDQTSGVALATDIPTGQSTAVITSSSSNPFGSVPFGTTEPPSATLAHDPVSVVQPYVAVYFWRRTA